ncbi:EAL domain-containing protein [Pelagibacterium limicola]|uniref:EAL domain-containing protein n=1 Tax=Pelagibacterium limicola TaxID=2791022 RepID=UPI0018AF895B|nr:EAL domain-containing protein [Pelagibacterium limicola]
MLSERNKGLPEKRGDMLDFIEMAMSRTDRAILISGSDREVCYVNPAFTTLFGYTLDDILATRPWELLAGPLTDIKVHERAQHSLYGETAFHDDLLLRTKSGDPIWVSARLEPVLDEKGQLTHVVALLADITNTKRLQVLQREVLEAMARDVPLVELMNSICSQVEALAPDIVSSVIAIDNEGRLRPLAAPSLPSSIAEFIDGLPVGEGVGTCGTAAWRGEVVVTPDIASDPAWEAYREPFMRLGIRACWSTPMLMRDGKVTGTFAFYFADERGPSAWHQQIVDTCVHLCGMAIEREEAKSRINQLAYFDGLTGLQNRASLRRRIGEKLRRDTGRRMRMAFLCVDIDRFKDINDTFGAPVGDGVLTAVGRRLSDHFGYQGAVCRLNGDAFIIALEDTDRENAARHARDVIAALLEPVQAADVTLPISSSVGIALYPDDAKDIDGLLRHCETAMFEAKAEARGSYGFYDPEARALNKERLVLGTALREAIALDQLELVYQPQVDGNSGAIYGAEALARWTHPQFGPVSPGRFIPIAEQIGVIEAIGNWAMRTACAQLADWRARGFDVPAISVNISPQQFRNRGFCESVAVCLERYKLVPSDLTVEITEGVMLEETPAVVANVRSLAEMGIRLSMDDFGTGHSSLSLLARLPVTELKIDRSFMDRIETDATAQAVVMAVIGIGQSLNMTLVAEGVETEAQRQFLMALGCAVHQGYHYAKPMSRESFEGWMSGRIARQVRRSA